MADQRDYGDACGCELCGDSECENTAGERLIKSALQAAEDVASLSSSKRAWLERVVAARSPAVQPEEKGR